MINVLEYLEATAARFPDKPAVVDREGSLTFGQLLERSRMVAGRIAARFHGRNEPVAVFLPKCSGGIVSFGGILYSGNFYSPLDTKSPVARLVAILDKLQPALVITDRQHAGAVRSAGIGEERILLLDEPDAATGGTLPAIPPLIDIDPVYAIHTSGSTGVPKGVIISHRGVIDYIDWARAQYRVTEEDTIGNQAPFHFDNSTLDIYLCFSTGATLVLIPEDLFLFPVRLLEYLDKESVRLIFWVPSVLAMIANGDYLSKTTRPPLRKILFAGEVMQNRHLNYWQRKYPEALFSNLYGPTEITVDCTYYIVDREFADDDPLPIGFPRRNMDVLVLTEENRPAAVGERGELCVRGTSLAHGYWRDPEKTSAAFTQNPLNSSYPEHIYRTGDLVYRNERGEIFFAGRRDGQIKHMGYRVELGEIETAAVGIPEVRNACAIYDPSASRIVMFYEAERELEAAYLRKFLLEKLPKYMIPAMFSHEAELPLNANRKIDRLQLTARMSK